MREIKFRIWVGAENNHGMHYPKVIQLFENGEVDKVWATGMKLSNDVDDMVLMQFTGLLDKNGKEIYEGDVVKYTPNPLVFPNTHEVYQAVWIRNGFAFRKDKGSFSPYLSEDKLQVIGNIYESPSLNTFDPAE